MTLSNRIAAAALADSMESTGNKCRFIIQYSEREDKRDAHSCVHPYSLLLGVPLAFGEHSKTAWCSLITEELEVFAFYPRGVE